ncbi:MAG: hypothetical protein EBZ15_07800, partial [Actinobacteria bacterium]|nr:hypothetical protein [Actinomycetota bacterium]
MLRWWSDESAGHRLAGRTAWLPGLALLGLAMLGLALPGSVAAPQQVVGYDQSHEEAGYHSDD